MSENEEDRPRDLPLPWCRLYAQEFLVDEKFRRIAVRTGEHVLLVRGLYIMLLCMAGKTRARDGKITLSEGEPLSLEEILWYLGLPAERAEPILADMERLKMIARPKGGPWEVINFSDRNPPSDATGAWRVKKYREKKKKEDRAPATPPRTKSGQGQAKSEKSAAPEGLDDTPQGRLIQVFTNETGFLPPADPTQCVESWEGPINGWLLLANDDEALVEDWIRRAIQKQRDDNYIFSKPASIDTAVRMIAEQVRIKKLWRKTRALIIKHGANSPPSLGGDLGKVVEAAGGWPLLAKLDESEAREKFAQAYNKVSHDRSDKDVSR